MKYEQNAIEKHCHLVVIHRKQTQSQLFKSPHRRTPGKHSRKRRNQSKHKIRDEIREKSKKNTQQRDSINQNAR